MKDLKLSLFLAVGLLIVIAGLVQAERNNYTTGDTPETEVIQYLKTNPSGVVQRVETRAGLVTVRWNLEGGKSLEDDSIKSLWWRDKKLMGDDQISIEAVCPEKNEKPSILIINKTCGGTICQEDQPYLVDMGVNPPFISKEPLPIALYDYSLDRPSVLILGIRKRAKDVYMFMGRSAKNNKDYSKSIFVTYVYDRKTGKIWPEK